MDSLPEPYLVIAAATANHPSPTRRYIPQCADLAAGRGPALMGVINVTPDSFSDGGDAATTSQALGRAHALIAEGADIVDIGGESTRPGADEIDAQTEVARVLPVIARLRAADSKIAISIDSYKASVAEAALNAGADIINDVWTLRRDPDLARVASDHGAPIILSHWDPDRDRTKDVVGEVAAFLSHSVEIALSAGVRQDVIILDPGLGFAKDPAENYVLLDRLGDLKALGFPILIGASRKSFIGRATGREAPKARLAGTLAYHSMAALNGADILRAHDIAPHCDALAVLCAAKTGTV
ncbi:MAG: dihydropteroate synthase [Pseudomonadota bacterium]